MNHELSSHPRMELLSLLLGCNHAQAVGSVELLLHFAARYAPAGDVGRWPDEMITRRCGWEGPPEQFIEAMLEARGPGEAVGFLVRDPEHRLVISNWPELADAATHLYLTRRGECFADGRPPRRLDEPQAMTAAEELEAAGM